MGPYSSNNTRSVIYKMLEEQQKGNSFWYMASPYSHPEKWIRHKRIIQAATFAGWLFQQNLYIYAPILHTHYIAELYDLPADFDFWKKYDLCVLNRCCGIIILAARGYMESKGIQYEAQFCMDHNMPIVVGIRYDLVHPQYKLCGPVDYINNQYYQKPYKGERKLVR